MSKLSDITNTLGSTLFCKGQDWEKGDSSASKVEFMCNKAADDIKQLFLELVGEDEKYTIVSTRYGTDDGSIVETIGDGEEEWKDPRNELRQELRNKIKEL